MKKILVVDDDPEVLETLKTILEDKGFKIQTVSNQEDIFENIISFQPKVILLDVNLKGSDGRNICKGLKNHFRTQQIPIILFSSDHKFKNDYLECKAEAFLEKPLEMDTLVHRLNDFCHLDGNQQMSA